MFRFPLLCHGVCPASQQRYLASHYFGMSERYWLDLQVRYDSVVKNEPLRALASREARL